MADIRINALANTATSAASDDYLALDGSANGTRKILATNVAQNVTDVTLGSAGPSVKSTLSARAPRQGLVFDGTAGATSSNVTAFGTGDFTIALWARSTTPALQVLVSYSASDSQPMIYQFANTSFSVGNHFIAATSLTTTKLLTWTRASGTSKFYVDGIQVDSWADTTNYSNPIDSIGKNSGGNYYTGYLFPIIENRAISASEVVSLYEAGAPSGADYNNASNTSVVSGANSNFSSDTGYWTKSSATIASGSCTISSGGYILKGGIFLFGKRYRYSITLSSNAGSVLIFNGSSGQVTITGTGTFTGEITTGDSTGSLYIYSSGGTAVLTAFSWYNTGLILAPDAAQAGGGYVWNDQSGNLAQIVLPSSGVQWALPSVAGQRIRGTTSTNGNQQLLGASVLLPAECQITHVRARARTGTPTITIGTASGGAQIVASVALSTTWLNCTIALTGGIVSSADDIWVGSNSTDVVETDIAFQPLDF